MGKRERETDDWGYVGKPAINVYAMYKMDGVIEWKVHSVPDVMF